jgi:hypothetical protein
MTDGPPPSPALWRVLDSCVKSVTGTRGGRALAAICVVIIAAGTLFPTDAVGGERFLFCLVCGDRGAADAVVNTIMFVPLGAALALSGLGASVVVPLSFVFSASIESIQFFIPGRDSSLGDLFFNTLGGALGGMAVWTALQWIYPDPRLARALSGSAVALFAVVVGITGWLLAPTHPTALYVVQWEPERYHLPPHPGEIVDVRLGDWSLPPETGWSPSRFRDAWNRGDTLVIRMSDATVPMSLAPILSVHDVRRREVLFIGDDAGELVVRPRLRALDARFDQPDFRHRERSSTTPRDSLTIRVAREGDGARLGMDGDSRVAYNTAGRGWALVYYLESFPGWMRSLLSLVWLAALCMPAGFWAHTRRSRALVGLAVIAVLAIVPAVTALGPTPLTEYAAALSGLLIGAGLAYVADRLRSLGRRAQPVASRVYSRA